MNKVISRNIFQLFSYFQLFCFQLLFFALTRDILWRKQWHPTLSWKIPWMEESGGLQSMGSQRVGHDRVTSLSLFTFMHWRRKWQPTPVFLPGESQGQGGLVGCQLWGRTESDTTEATQQQQQQRYFVCFYDPISLFLSVRKTNLRNHSAGSPCISLARTGLYVHS